MFFKYIDSGSDGFRSHADVCLDDLKSSPLDHSGTDPYLNRKIIKSLNIRFERMTSRLTAERSDQLS